MSAFQASLGADPCHIMSAFPVRHIRAPCLLSWTGGRESLAAVGVYSAESHLVGSAGETVFVRQLQEIARLMGWGGYQNLLGEDGSFGGVCTSLAGAKVLEMLYVHKKEVQMFAGLTLRMAKVEPVTGCLPGYTTTSRVAGQGLCELGCAGATPASLKTRFLGFGHT